MVQRLIVIARISCVIAFFSLAGFHQRCQAQPGPRDKLAGLQRRLTAAAEGYVELSLSLYASGFGGSVKQAPASVTIAWKKPSLYYVHEPQSGKNPAPAYWYWLEEGRLQAFQYWEKGQPYDQAQARGVRVVNFAQLAGDGAEAAYRLAKDKTIDFAVLGGIGAAFLEVLGEAQPKAMEIERRDGGWRLKQRAMDFKNWMVRESLSDDKTAAFVAFDVVEDEQPLKAISIYPDLKKWPDYSQSAKIERFQFALDRKRLTFPKPQEVTKPVELKEKDKIRSDILDSIRPVPIASRQ